MTAAKKKTATKTTAAKELEILNEGRTPVKVELLDGSEATITIKKVGLVDMPALAATTGDYPAEAAAYLDPAKHPEPDYTIAQISDESITEICERGREINDPLLLRWLKLREQDMQRQGIDLQQLRADLIAKITHQSHDNDNDNDTNPPD